MPDEIVVYGPNARLDVTFRGQQGTYPDPVRFDMPDGDAKGIVAEAIRTGYIPGIDRAADVNLNDYMVDRFEAKDGLPDRLSIRPKTAYGA